MLVAPSMAVGAGDFLNPMTSPQEEREFVEYLTVTPMLDAAIEWIGENLYPGDVFNKSKLEYWALNNGFVKEDK